MHTILIKGVRHSVRGAAFESVPLEHKHYVQKQSFVYLLKC